MTARRVACVAAVLAGFALVAAGCDYVHPPFLARVDAPVVLTGADVPAAIGLDPARVIGYRWKDGWVQIPVQIDQRVVVGFGTAPSSNTTPGTTGTVYGDGSADLTALQYADPDTFVGPDTDPMIDADDELVFMARDAGPRVPAGTARPADAVASGVEVDLVDSAGSHGYVYLFYGHAGVDPSAGQDYVSYDFALDSGDYKTTYQRADGPNPEHSTVVGETYQMGMIDRWKTVDLRVNGSSADILDGFKARFSFDTCGRSNDTFADAEGAFVANIDGPVRAIRSYVGANSGPRTEETMYFYANRVEIVTDLRVHAIPGIMSFADFSTAASGMQYGNSEMSGTVTVDGVPDVVPSTVPAWSYVAGAPGFVSWTDDITTDIPNLDQISLTWTDDATPAFEECWGSDGLWGAAAVQITEALPNTDPVNTPTAHFRGRHVLGLWPANVDAADLDARCGPPPSSSPSPSPSRRDRESVPDGPHEVGSGIGIQQQAVVGEFSDQGRNGECDLVSGPLEADHERVDDLRHRRLAVASQPHLRSGAVEVDEAAGAEVVQHRLAVEDLGRHGLVGSSPASASRGRRHDRGSQTEQRVDRGDRLIEVVVDQPVPGATARQRGERGEPSAAESVEVERVLGQAHERLGRAEPDDLGAASRPYRGDTTIAASACAATAAETVGGDLPLRSHERRDCLVDLRSQVREHRPRSPVHRQRLRVAEHRAGVDVDADGLVGEVAVAGPHEAGHQRRLARFHRGGEEDRPPIRS